jgi:hypothetical protein
VATLVAGGALPADVFTAVADELGHLIGAEATFVSRLMFPVPAGAARGRRARPRLTRPGNAEKMNGI